jgi:iron complex outermembrane receptor protein
LRLFFTFLASTLIAIAPISLKAEEKDEVEGDKILITAEEIEKINVRTIVELLNQVPGISAGESSVNIWGSYMVKVLLDGRPINNPLSAHRSINWALVSLKNVEKVEIYKGRGSVVFGDDTSGGVISITTRKIKKAQGNIEASGGNFNTKYFNLNYRQEFKPFGIGLSAGWENTDGFRKNDDTDRKKVGAKVSYSSPKDYLLDLSLDYAQRDRGMPGLPAFPTPRARSEDEALSTSLLFETGPLKSGTYYNRFENINKNPDKNIETILKGQTLGGDLKSGFSLGRWGLIHTGINLEVAQAEGNKIESHREGKLGIYGAKEIPFKEIPLTLGLGLRGNFYSEFPTAVNPEVKLNYKLTNWKIQAHVSKTNNTPTFLQRYYETSTTQPNPDLGMEKAMNYTLAFSYHREKFFDGGLSLFFNDIRDCITYVRKDGGIGRYENFGRVTRKGGELSLKWKPSDILEIRPSYTYLVARDESTGNWLPASPEHKVRLSLQLKPFQDLILFLDTVYVSKQFNRADNKESVPGYFVANLRADYHLKKVRLFLKVENLLDKKYFYGDGYPAPPLSWYVGLNYEF